MRGSDQKDVVEVGKNIGREVGGVDLGQFCRDFLETLNHLGTSLTVQDAFSHAWRALQPLNGPVQRRDEILSHVLHHDSLTTGFVVIQGLENISEGGILELIPLELLFGKAVTHTFGSKIVWISEGLVDAMQLISGEETPLKGSARCPRVGHDKYHIFGHHCLVVWDSLAAVLF